MNVYERAKAYVGAKAYLHTELGNVGPHYVSEGYVAGFNAAKGDPEVTAPLVRAARDQERKRVKAILECEEADGREKLAKRFAYQSDMTAEAAIAIMKDTPAERPKLLNPETDALLAAALRGAGLKPESALNLAMHAERLPTTPPSQPGPEPKDSVASLNVTEINRERIESEHRQREEELARQEAMRR